jgi:hypothetical protein
LLLTTLPDILRHAGIPVIEEPGWAARGHGPMSGTPKTIVCHHTGGLKDLRVIIDGRPGLAGPLAHIWLARTGVWHVVAAGKCWHAGVVRDPSYANEWAVGIEAEATGVDPWPIVQYQSYAKGCAALVKAYRLTPDDVLGHKEVCAPVGRKNDPNFSMPTFRQVVGHYLSLPEEDVFTDADKAWISAEIDKRVRAALAAEHATPRPWLSQGVAAYAETLWPGITSKGIPVDYLAEFVWKTIVSDTDDAQLAQIKADVEQLLAAHQPPPPPAG